MDDDTVTLYRPTGPAERALLEASGWTRWPPRLPEQPIFYPVTNEQYAREIAAKWNVAASGAGYVTRFRVRRAFMDVESATAQVSVAKSALDLANQQLTQARDRFAAGVAGSLDIVESEQAVTEANENLISALYANNVAKATLARATGRAEQLVKDFLGAK